MNAIARKVYAQRDRVVRAIAKNGRFRFAAIRNTKTVQTAQNNHALSPLTAVLLGRAMTSASLLAAFLKSEERVIVELMGNGPVGKVFAESLQLGEVRGYVTNPATMLDFSNPNTMLSDALGVGMMRVSRILYGNYEPVIGLVELIEGDVSTDLAYYLMQSEQIPSAVLLDVSIDENGIVQQSGGLLIQAMPGANEQQIRSVYDSLQDLGNLPELFENGYTPQEIMQMITVEPLDQMDDTPVDFFCRCSLDRFKSTLATLGIDEIRSMKEAEQRELVCHYCNKHYHLSDLDFDDLLIGLQAKTN